MNTIALYSPNSSDNSNKSSRNLQVARVLTVVSLLSQNRNGMTTKEIHARVSEIFPVSMRTIYRDLMAIEMAGYVLQHVPNGNVETWATRWAIVA
jgi:Fe2+ or Zn2+ uptake regulation protein